MDENVSHDLAAFLKSLGEPVLHIRNNFLHQKDEVWIPKVGKLGWIVISMDARIVRRPNERRLYKKHKLGGFMLDGGNMRAIDVVKQIFLNWDRILELAAETKKPYYLRVPKFKSRAPWKELLTGEELL